MEEEEEVVMKEEVLVREEVVEEGEADAAAEVFVCDLDDEISCLIDAAYSRAMREGALALWGDGGRLEAGTAGGGAAGGYGGYGGYGEGAGAASLREARALAGAAAKEDQRERHRRRRPITIDLHGYSVPLARAAMRHVFAELRGWGDVDEGTPDGGYGGYGEGAGAASLRDEGTTDEPPAPAPTPPVGKKRGRRKAGEEEEGEEEDGAGLIIITGRGRGSGMAAVLGPMVQSMLSDELSPPLAANNVPGNDGRLLVPRASLWAWLRANRERVQEQAAA